MEIINEIHKLLAKVRKSKERGHKWRVQTKNETLQQVLRKFREWGYTTRTFSTKMKNLQAVNKIEAVTKSPPTQRSRGYSRKFYQLYKEIPAFLKLFWVWKGKATSKFFSWVPHCHDNKTKHTIRKEKERSIFQWT